ncbi:MAG: hypothetical protein D6679_13035, partial [Candidatus Hydrogenedentota bacterium]
GKGRGDKDWGLGASKMQTVFILLEGEFVVQGGSDEVNVLGENGFRFLRPYSLMPSTCWWNGLCTITRLGEIWTKKYISVSKHFRKRKHIFPVTAASAHFAGKKAFVEALLSGLWIVV